MGHVGVVVGVEVGVVVGVVVVVEVGVEVVVGVEVGVEVVVEVEVVVGVEVGVEVVVEVGVEVVVSPPLEAGSHEPTIRWSIRVWRASCPDCSWSKIYDSLWEAEVFARAHAKRLGQIPGQLVLVDA